MHVHAPTSTQGRAKFSVWECQFLVLCRDKSVIPTLNLWIWPLHTDDFKALIIHQGRGKAEREREKFDMSPSHSFYTHSYTPTHWHIKYAELGLAWGHFSYISIKQNIIFLWLEVYDWCACHLFGLHCQRSKKYEQNTKLYGAIWDGTRIVFRSVQRFAYFFCHPWKTGQTRTWSTMQGLTFLILIF